ncbi:MAG: M20/M25/M40 family metallo-hydrolase [Verrucomicrobia bacterium]|nr:M20/M25/M40 family metallo-hydrolase [Verrucomicrobiota bacterium]
MKPAHFLAELIALPSVNPAFLPAGDPRAGEHRVADFLAATAARGGLDVEFHEVTPNRRNLIARFTPSGRVKKRVVLAPHTDTVGDLRMSDRLFQPEIRNGRLYGRGACDTKGSVASMLMAVLSLALQGRRPATTEIIFAGLIDEENSQLGSRALVRSGFKADLAIVGEPTQLQVVTAHKGDLWLKVTTRGKSAHGAKPHLGKNAIHSMAQIINLIETDYATTLKKQSHPLLGQATVNVGSIRGGTQPNIVPDWCEISIDRRTLPGETSASVLRGLRKFLVKHGLKATINDSKGAPAPSLETNPRLPLVQALLASVGQNSTVGVDYFCDAAILAAGGIPSVVFGPGDIAQAHTATEWISVRQLDQAVAQLVGFLRSLP